MNVLSTVIKKLREEKKLSQKEVAKALNISPASYNMYEKGKREPNADILQKIADYFGVTIDYLIGWDNPHYINFFESHTPSNITKQRISHYFNNIKANTNTIEIHFDSDEFTEDELDNISAYAEFVKSRRNKEKQDDDI